MKLAILDRSKKKKIIEALKYSGLKKIPQLLIRSGRERIRAYSGSLSNEEIMDLWRLLPIEGIGLYTAKEHIDKNGVREVRMSVDAAHVWKDQIHTNIIELEQTQEEQWFKGKNLELDCQEFKREYITLKSKESGDFIGTGKAGIDGKTIFNFLPKERRRKSQVL